MYFIDVPHFIALFFNCGSLGLCLIFATINYVLVHIAFIAHSLPQPQILDFFSCNLYSQKCSIESNILILLAS